MLRNLSIQKRLMILSISGVVAIIILALVAWMQIKTLGAELLSAVNDVAPLVESLYDIKASEEQRAIYLDLALMTGSDFDKNAENVKRFEAARKKYFQVSQDLSIKTDALVSHAQSLHLRNAFSGHEKQLSQLSFHLRDLSKAQADFNFVAKTRLNLLLQKKADKLKFNRFVFKSKQKHLKKTIERLDKEIAAFSQTIQQQAGATSTTAMAIFIIFALIFGILSFVASILMGRSISDPLKSAAKKAKSFTEGEVDIDFSTESRDEVGQLLSALSLMLNHWRASQDSLIQADKLSVLGEMAAGIAHEIKNPLSVIDGFSRIIAKELTKESPSTSRLSDGNEKIKVNSERIKKIIEGMQRHSRDSSQDELELTSVSEIIDHSLELCHNRLMRAGIELRTEVPEHPLYINARSGQIAQVIINLLNNSHDALENLEKDTWVKLSVQGTVSEVIIAVEDCGTGIDPAIRDKLMDPFFTTKAVGKGTGLGLSISSGIIKNHAGTLTIDDQSPHTRFVMILPRVYTQESAA